jgi:predicted ATPase
MTMLPAGTLTFLFTDVEGSTRVVAEVGESDYATLLAEHFRVLRGCVSGHNGTEFGTEGDALFSVFRSAHDAIAAATEAQDRLQTCPLRVRMGIHTGEPVLGETGYVGLDVHRASRIASAGHGGQVLVSHESRALVGDDFDLHDLGEHRLKDLAGRVRLYQLGAIRFPPLRSLNWSNLPVPASTLVGRELEIAEVRALALSARVVTLTGPGGIGKTRLAIAAATGLVDEFPDGAWFVDLSALRDPDLVLATAAGIVTGGDNPQALTGKRALLVLDNFEQLLAAAGDVGALLRIAPGLRLLVTSREALRIEGEHEYQVPPLPESDSVALFVDRARAASPSFEADEAVVEICRRLDGLPLAVQLAAARARSLPAHAILRKLEQRLTLLTQGSRDLPARQQTLRATIEWSYDLLDPSERVVFETLGVFAGGFTADAAEEIDQIDVDVLAKLVERSLVRFAGQRYMLLETIREFATERLLQRGDLEELRARHARAYLGLVERARGELDGPDQALWLRVLDRDADNVREALAWALGREDGELALQLARGLARLWRVRARYAEGRYWLERALSFPSSADERAKGLITLSSIVIDHGDYDAGARVAGEAIELCRGELGDAVLLGKALNNMGAAELYRNNLAAAEALFEETLELARVQNNPVGSIQSIHNLGEIAQIQRKLAEAQPRFEAALAIAREQRHLYLATYCLRSLASVFIDLGDEERAAHVLAETFDLALELENHEAIGDSLENTAALAAVRGDAAGGARLLGAAATLRGRFELSIPPAHARRLARIEAVVHEAAGEVVWLAAYAEGGALSVESAVASARTVLTAQPVG